MRSKLKLRIRNASSEDAGIVRELSLSACISSSSRRSCGFVDFETPSEEEYQVRIRSNSHFYVAELSGTVIGFMANYSSQVLENRLFPHDKIMKHFLEKEKPFVYGEQLTVTSKHRENGVGRLLFEHCLNDIIGSYPVFFGAIAHNPFRNEPSISLCEQMGLGFFEELEDGVLTFGLYKKLLP
jgi:hypothetical protein